LEEGWARLLRVGRTVLLAGAAIILVLAALIAGTVTARRRRNRRKGSPAERVAAAWRSTVAVLARSGMTAPASATPSQLLASASEHLGGAMTADLTALMNGHRTARYGRLEMSQAQAEQAWQRRDRVQRAMRRARRARLLDSLIRLWDRKR